MAQLNYRDCVTAIANLRKFKGNTMWGEWQGALYNIYSYRTLMASVKEGGNNGAEIVYLDQRRYSVTTSKQQGYIAQGLDGLPFAVGAEVYER